MYTIYLNFLFPIFEIKFLISYPFASGNGFNIKVQFKDNHDSCMLLILLLMQLTLKCNTPIHSYFELWSLVWTLLLQTLVQCIHEALNQAYKKTAIKKKIIDKDFHWKILATVL